MMDVNDIEGVKHFIRPIRMRERLLKQHAVPDMPTQAVIIVCAHPIPKEALFRHFTEEERSHVYIVQGSPFARLTLDMACVHSASRVCVHACECM
jgi:hypothetical protein